MKASGIWRRLPGIDRWMLAILIALPLLVYFVYASRIDPINHYYANYDPEFPYLLNSLAVFEGQPYLYTDHPGTPLEVIGTGIYALTYILLGRSTPEFISFHLRYPGVFLSMAHGFLLVASVVAGALLAFGVAARRTLADRLMALALALMYFVLHPMAFASLMVWSHNSFSYAFGTPILVAILRLTSGRGARGSASAWSWAAVGAAAGLLAAVTIYMAAWIVTAVIALVLCYRLQGIDWSRTLRGAVAVILSSAVGFFLGVLPALPRMPVFFDWIESLLSHRSPYLLEGTDQGWIARLADNLMELARQMPVLTLAVAGLLLLTAVALGRWRHRIAERPGPWAVALALNGQILVLTAFILDHPKAEYMLSVAAVVPILTAALLTIYDGDPKAIRILRPGLTALILVGVVAALVLAASRHHSKASMIQRVDDQVQREIETYALDRGITKESVSIVWTYGAYSPCLSLWFGNDVTGNAFRREIGQLCPRDYEFDPWSQRIVPGRGSGTLSDMDWDMVIGCAGAFQTAALKDVYRSRVFPDLELSCGSLTIGEREG